MFEVILILLLSAALSWPLGRYLGRLFGDGPAPLDRWLLPIEHRLCRLFSSDPRRGMSVGGYTRAFLGCNLVLGVLVFLLLLGQGQLPLNPDGIPGMSWDLALHTTISFLTNTNQQHYSGQAQLSYLGQLAGIVALQVVTPAMGLAVCVAVLRGLAGGRNRDVAGEGEARDVGNYYLDVTRAVLRVMLPLALVLSLLLTSQGVPASFQGAAVVAPLDASAGTTEQVIPRGPIAPMVAIKQLGTNGGGWHGPNSAVALENPTGISNALQSIAILLLPMAIVWLAGSLLGRPRLGVVLFGVMALFSLLFVGASVWSERQPNMAFDGLAAEGSNMEGKEVRFGTDASALWATLTTQTSNGSVNAMHDSLNPLAGLVTLSGMVINGIWGGVGGGLEAMLVYLLFAVFIGGLMIGRTPEFYGRKLEVREIRWLSLLIVLQPLLILGATATTLAAPGLAGNSNPGFHGVSQVFYEYTSAFANNGSGFEGLGDGTPWWNLSCAALLLAGRFAALLIPLAVAGSLAIKRVAPSSSGSLDIETPTFAGLLLATIVLLTLLCFLPIFALGPVGEWLSIGA
jgi:K+-transporting ATPase ATPase A chain